MTAQPHVSAEHDWSWGGQPAEQPRPSRHAVDFTAASEQTRAAIVAEHPGLGSYVLGCEALDGAAPALLFTENETNSARLFGGVNAAPYMKDGIDAAVVQGRADAINPALVGTKAAAHYRVTIGAGATATLRLRLHKIENEKLSIEKTSQSNDNLCTIFNSQCSIRQAEADAFYAALQPPALSDDQLSEIWTIAHGEFS